jgi:hypothetical protein
MEEPEPQNGGKPQAYIVLQHPSGSLVRLLLTARYRATEAPVAASPPPSRSGFLTTPVIIPFQPAGLCCWHCSRFAQGLLAFARRPARANGPLPVTTASRRAPFACPQAAQDVSSLINRVNPAVVVVELDEERERKLLEQARSKAAVLAGRVPHCYCAPTGAAPFLRAG